MGSTAEGRGRATRRTEGVQVGGRAAEVVSRVLAATAQELSRVGYAAMRVEDVAARSGVNKTTIYRRWPTKAELVNATMQEVVPGPVIPDTGSLREDLFAAAQTHVKLSSTALGRGLMRMLQTERTHPEVEPIARRLRQQYRRARIALVERAIERGELPSGTSAELIVDLVFAPLFSRFVVHGEPTTEEFVRALIDVVLAGARTGAGVVPPARP